MWGVNKETEGAGREWGKDVQIGKGHRRQLITPWLPWGCHMPLHKPLSPTAPGKYIQVPSVTLPAHSHPVLPSKKPACHMHTLSKNSSPLAFQCVCPGTSVQRIWRLPHLTPLFWKSENKRGSEKLNNCLRPQDLGSNSSPVVTPIIPCVSDCKFPEGNDIPIRTSFSIGSVL